MKWIVHLRDGSSADVVSDEVICEGTARVREHVAGARRTRY